MASRIFDSCMALRTAPCLRGVGTFYLPVDKDDHSSVCKDHTALNKVDRRERIGLYICGRKTGCGRKANYRANEGVPLDICCSNLLSRKRLVTGVQKRLN